MALTSLYICIATFGVFVSGVLVGWWARGDRVNQSGCIAGGDIVGGDRP